MIRNGRTPRPGGALIVFEGQDGVGKSALAGFVAEHLKSNGYQCDTLSFPGQESGTLGRHVYELHHEPNSFGIRQVHPASLQVLHVAAHIDTIECRIRPALALGRVVVLDRFWWSTWVYGKVSNVSPAILERIIEIERLYLTGLRPTVLFLIQRKHPLRKDAPACWQNLAEEYRHLAEKEAKKYPIEVIQNNVQIEKAQLQVVDAMARHGFSSKQRNSPPRPGQPSQGNDHAKGLSILVHLAPAKTTDVYDTYWSFASERQSVFFRRLAGDPPPWTDDLILQQYKFTNAYRASDRVSQYLIRHVIYEGDCSPEDVVFRVLLFKLFNKIETWELLKDAFGIISLKNYSFERFDEVLTAATKRGRKIYSAAYIMPSGAGNIRESRKHRMHLKLLEAMMERNLPKELQSAPSMGKAFEILRSFPSIGDFLAYQYVTDINYSSVTDFSEMEFVVAGPGARDGIRKCFSDLGGLTETEIIRAVADRQESEFERLGVDFKSLWGRPLQLIDCQNIFCEVSKYARVRHPDAKGLLGRVRIKQLYRPNTEPIEFWYPPKWGLNGCIRETVSNDQDVPCKDSK